MNIEEEVVGMSLRIPRSQWDALTAIMARRTLREGRRWTGADLLREALFRIIEENKQAANVKGIK